MRYGWNQDSLPTGTTVTVTGSRARDGSLKAAADKVTLPDGKQLFGARIRRSSGLVGGSGTGAGRRFFREPAR